MATLLTEDEISVQLASADQWERRGPQISRQFTFRDFSGSLQFVNAVAAAAEAVNHHPDIDIRWNKVLLVLSTHSKGGLTALDFELARTIDRLA